MDTSDWQQEYNDFVRAEQKKRGGKSRIVKPTDPKPKLSDLIRCAELAKGQPEIWDLAVEKAQKTPEQRDAEEDYHLGEMCDYFASWFRFKNGLRDHLPDSFCYLHNVLLYWAEAGVGGDKIAIARHWFRGESYIDDVTNGGSGK